MIYTEEEWKSIDGYLISNTGRIIGKKGKEILGTDSHGYKTCFINLCPQYGVVVKKNRKHIEGLYGDIFHI